MVNYLRQRDSSVKVAILKSRKFDFYRINPVGVMRNGFNRLIRHGVAEKGEKRPEENPNFFITPAFILHWSKTRFTDNNIHVGFTVSKRTTSKRANKRNLLRRRLRYSVNQNIRKYDIEGYDFVFTARAGILECEYEQLNYHIRRALKFAETKINGSSSSKK